MKEHIEALIPLFTLDPILIYAVLCFCPKKDAALLSDQVPIHLALGRIADQLDKYSNNPFQTLSQLEVHVL